MSNAISKWKRSMFVLIVHWFYVDQEEALQAFIQPETLDGPNQYFCERCKKKCDARKVSQIRDDDCLVVCHISSPLQFLCSGFFFSLQGLRFLHFPYLLTLQLKRFDFDYTTMHRIKLNDRMTFPEELDMSPFIDVEDEVRCSFVLSFLWLRRTELISPALLTSHITTYSYILWKYVVLNII